MTEDPKPPTPTNNGDDLERAHNLGQEHEHDDRAPIVRGWDTVGMSEAELEAYEKGVQNVRESC